MSKFIELISNHSNLNDSNIGKIAQGHTFGNYEGLFQAWGTTAGVAHGISMAMQVTIFGGLTYSFVGFVISLILCFTYKPSPEALPSKAYENSRKSRKIHFISLIVFSIFAVLFLLMFAIMAAFIG